MLDVMKEEECRHEWSSVLTDGAWHRVCLKCEAEAEAGDEFTGSIEAFAAEDIIADSPAGCLILATRDVTDLFVS